MAKKSVDKTKDAQAGAFASDISEFLQKSAKVQSIGLDISGEVPYWIDTKSYALNWIIGNDMFKGIPGTKNVIISGESGKGKSLICDVILGSNIEMGGVSLKVDVEKSAGFDFTAQIVGGPEIAKQIQVIKPSGSELITIEKLTTILNRLVDYQTAKKDKKNKSIVVVIDSITQLTSDKEVSIVNDRGDSTAKGNKVKDKKDMTAAQKMRELGRVIEQRMEDANLTVIGVAQLTALIGVMFGPDKTENLKGSGPKYSSSLTLQMISDKVIEDKKTKTPVGIRMKLKTTKNRVAYKGRSCWIQFYFSRGVDRFGGLAWLLGNFGILKPLGAATADAIKKIKTEEDFNALKCVKGEQDLSFKENCKFAYWYKDQLLVFYANNMHILVEELGDDIIHEMNDKLTAQYKMILDNSGITDENLLDEDELEDGDDTIYSEDEE